MAKVIGFDPKVLRQFTCYECSAIVQYVPQEDGYTDQTDEGINIRGLNCPNCNTFHRTNP